jgi:tellurite methyltransferase
MDCFFIRLLQEIKITLTPPNNPDYLLIENELLRQFSSLRVIFYRENALMGDLSQGLRNEAQFIGQKRK